MINRVLICGKRSAFHRVAISMLMVGWINFGARAALPDLIPNKYLLKKTIRFEKRTITRENCAFAEGCLRGISTRKLFLFDTGVGNIGKADLVIGDPNRLPYMFKWSPCHGHYHLNAFARYRLFARKWRLAIKSSKQGFCLRDDRRYLSVAQTAPKYTCDYQGISRGWQDVYDSSLDCQWLDITGVPPGKYYLEVVINPTRILKESNYKNNRAVIPITVPVVR